jgi:hypothetical protein
MYNFDPYLQHIVQPNEVNFNSFQPFITASKDARLLKLAQQNQCKFVSSTSSLSGALSQMYFFLSGDKPLEVGRFSSEFKNEVLGSRPQHFLSFFK